MERKRTWYKMIAAVLVIGMLFGSRSQIDATNNKTGNALNITELSLSVGQSKTISVSNVKKVKWISSSKAVITVSSKGKVKAKRAGKATVTAKFSGKELKCNVVVNNPSSKKKKILIAYFSKTGTTKKVAQKIQKLTGGDLLRIRERDKYTSNYEKLTKIAQKEIKNNTRPKITTESGNMKTYDVVYVGYPIWWGTTPRVVNTFLEKYDLKGKTIIPFCTSGGSDIKESLSDLKKSCKGAKVKKGYTADSGSTSEIKEWLTEIGEWKTEVSKPEPSVPNTDPEPSAGTKVLVAYFSATHTTEGVAKMVAEVAGADVYEITPEIAYTDADLNYQDSNSRTTREKNDPLVRPAILGEVADMEQYETVFVGYPIWWGQAPRIVSTFLESYDFSGKTIIPFCTSASSGIGTSAVELEKLTPNTTWLSGRRFGAGTSKDEIENWISTLEADRHGQKAA